MQCRSQCTKCGSPWDTKAVVNEKLIKRGQPIKIHDIFSSRTIVDGTVMKHVCSDSTCTGELLYDGGHDHMFVFSNRTMFTHRLLAMYDIQLASHTFHSYVNSLSKVHEMHSSVVKMCTRKMVTNAWFQWLELRLFDYDDGFSCSICSKLPLSKTCWTVDATAHSIRKSALVNDFGWKLSLKPPPSTIAERSGLNPTNRLWCVPAKIRKLLKAWSKATKDNPLPAIDFATLNDEYKTANDAYKKKVKSPLRDNGFVGLWQFIHEIVGQSEGQFKSYCPKELATFISCLSRNTPATGFVLKPRIIGPVLLAISMNVNVLAIQNCVTILLEYCPIILDVLKCTSIPVYGIHQQSNHDHQHIHPYLVKLFGHLAQLCAWAAFKEGVKNTTFLSWKDSNWFNQFVMDEASIIADVEPLVVPVQPISTSNEQINDVPIVRRTSVRIRSIPQSFADEQVDLIARYELQQQQLIEVVKQMSIEERNETIETQQLPSTFVFNSVDVINLVDSNADSNVQQRPTSLQDIYGRQFNEPFKLDQQYDVTFADDWTAGQYFSAPFRKRRCVPIYKQDKKPQKQKSKDGSVDIERDTVVECDREREYFRNKTPGLITLFCPHDICYGFWMLTENESVKHVFDIFLHRFSEAPHLIHYDRGCQLHQYIMHREPIFFRDTICRIDITHYKNHVNCSKGYDPNTYRQVNSYARSDNRINSQVCEQFNSSLKHVRDQVGFMTQHRYLLFTRFFLYQLNQRKKQNPNWIHRYGQFDVVSNRKQASKRKHDQI